MLYAPDGATLLAYLSDTTVCEITEERNGIFELYLVLPTASAQFPLIENDCWLVAKPNDIGNDQWFRVYQIEKTMRGTASISAEHVSYLLTAYPIDALQQSGLSATAAMNAILTRAAAVLGKAHGFTAVSDIATVSDISFSATSARAALGGSQGSVLQLYGGEFDFDNKIVRLFQNRGQDRGVKIEYRKNLAALKASISTESSYTALCPFAKIGEETIFLPEKILTVANNTNIQSRVLLRDFSQSLPEEATADQLRTAAQKYLNANDINAPSISLDVDFVHLWQSPEYADYADLERVALCDIVTVRHPDLGVDVSAKVIKTVYDALAEHYKKITIGSAKSNMAAVIAGVREEIEAIELPDLSGVQILIDQAVQDASDAIKNGFSQGKVILNPVTNPQELLILCDQNSTIQTAQKLWRFNSGGLGFSSTGYNGSYGTAITANGAIVADFITAGVLTANVIKAGILTDVAGKFSVNMVTGAASLSGATITGGSVTITNGSRSTVIDANGLTTSYATITGGSVSIGGATWRTEVAAGALNQYALGNGTFICGLTPFSAGNEYRPTIYIGSDSRVTGFSIAYQSGGNIVNIAEFDKTEIELIKPVIIDAGISGSGNINISGTLTTNNGTANTFAGINHYRYVTNYGTAQVKFGCGSITANSTNYATAAIEVGPSGYSSPSGRLDVFESWGAAIMCLRGSGYGSTSGILELGASTLYWRGGAVSASSTADVKANIAAAPSALKKIVAAGIYSYDFVGKQTAGSLAPQAVERPAPEEVGFVIGDGFTPPPAEILGEDGESINLYATAAMAWKGIQELNTLVTDLQAQVRDMRAEIQTLKGASE
jgi:phage minor structural protein